MHKDRNDILRNLWADPWICACENTVAVFASRAWVEPGSSIAQKRSNQRSYRSAVMIKEELCITRRYMEKWTCNMCDARTEQQLHVGTGGGRGGGKEGGGGCSRTACLLAALGVMAGVRVEWSWAAETFFWDWSTIIGSTVFSASCQHFLCHCFLVSAPGVEVYPAWEAAGSAIWDPVRNYRRQRPCIPFSVAFKISCVY